ncbi:MAG TPA: COX15/CtaA family protein, partial [Accumulibacter sp.]|nr:COX15/CtaA family protein [Accumulibacter sp.]
LAALAVLGIWSGEARLMPIVFLNLLGGLGLVSFSWRIFLATANAAPRTPTTPAPPTLRFGTLTLTLTVLCGAAIGAGQLALTCTTFPDCDGQWWPFVRDGAAWFALPDWHPSIADSKTLHLLHRYAALLSVLLLGHGVWMLWRSGNRRLASVVMVSLLTGTAALGIAMLLSDFPLRLASAHVLSAAALLAAVATVQKR